MDTFSIDKKHKSLGAVEALEETWNIFLIGYCFTHVEFLSFYDRFFLPMFTSNHLDFEDAFLILDDAFSVE